MPLVEQLKRAVERTRRGFAAKKAVDETGAQQPPMFGFSGREGESDLATIDIEIAGVLPAGRYRLRYDMVVEGVTWFEFHGSECVERSLDVVDPPTR